MQQFYRSYLVIAAAVILLIMAGAFVWLRVSNQGSAAGQKGSVGSQRDPSGGDPYDDEIDPNVDGDEALSQTPQEANDEANAHVAKDTESEDANLVELSIEAGSFYFSPKNITVKQGQRVRITLTAKDMMHNFYIDELDVASSSVEPGETVLIEFTATKKGTFEYYCAVGEHKRMGQVGTLIVE